MKRLCEFYIRHARLVGALFCIVPLILTYAVMFIVIPFRAVYVLRLVLSLVFGGWLSAYVNNFGLSLWLIKHRSAEGPATVRDGMLIGAGVGVAVVLIPLFVAPLATHHLEEIKSTIIFGWLVGLASGAIVGSFLAVIGRQHVSREPLNAQASPQVAEFSPTPEAKSSQ